MRKLLECIEIRQTSCLNRYRLYFQHVPLIWQYYSGTVCLNISHSSAWGFPRLRPGFIYFSSEKERILERAHE
jgi:hypothetical protein